MLTNGLGSLRASGRAQLAKCDSWVGKGRVNFTRSGSCGIDLAVELEEWQECLVFLVLAALTSFVRSRRILLIISPSGVGVMCFKHLLGSTANVCVCYATAFVCVHPHLCSLRLGCMIGNCGMDCMHHLVYGGEIALLSTSFPISVPHTRLHGSPDLRPVGYAN
jgi:hypothetical protein